ncbi:MAG: response regulator [Pseudomonas sp.]|nr:MAG: response regulator [Pseudomonas sp.]
MRILIVEDEALIAMMLADGLEDAGHEIAGPVATTDEALALCEATLPDLALLDVNLAEGGDGVVLAGTLLARWGLLVVFASAQSPALLQARSSALGVIKKPYDMNTVLRGVEVARAVLDGQRPVDVPTGFSLFSR